MADVFALDHENYHLGNIPGMVGDPFQILGNIDQLYGPLDTRGILHHIGQEVTLQLDVQIIDELVIAADLGRELRIFLDKGVK